MIQSMNPNSSSNNIDLQESSFDQKTGKGAFSTGKELTLSQEQEQAKEKLLTTRTVGTVSDSQKEISGPIALTPNKVNTMIAAVKCLVHSKASTA